MLRITVRTLLDRVLDLPWLFVLRIRHAAAAVRRRSPDALDVLGRPVVVGGLARKLAFGVRSTALAAADALGGLPAFVRQRGFRPLAPRAIALVATPLATAALVLVVAEQAPSLVRGANQEVLAVSMGVEEPAAAAVVSRVEQAAPVGKAPLPRARAARSAASFSRSKGANARSATIERGAVRQATSQAASVRPRAAVAPRSSTRKASPLAPKAAPRVSATPTPPDARPRRPKRSGGGDETPRSDDPPTPAPTPTPTPTPTGGGGDETPQDDDPGDDNDRDDDRGDRDRGDDDDRRDRDRDKGDEGDKDHDDDDDEDEDEDEDDD